MQDVANDVFDVVESLARMKYRMSLFLSAYILAKEVSTMLQDSAVLA